MSRIAFLGADVFDGTALRQGRALLLDGDLLAGIVEPSDVPADYERRTLDGGTISPGFIDLQVNGGGGVLFNDQTSVEGLATIAAAHAKTGTLAILPTLITDTPEKTLTAIDAVSAAIEGGISGILGIHLEGPHLSVARKGAHDPALIRPMLPEDEALLREAAARLPNVMLTVAPENVTNAQISRLSEAGAIVSLGHTDCSFAEARAAIAAGATCVTHLFNAMSQLVGREPGLVGATLESGTVSAGLIADSIHVHPSSIRSAIAAKTGPGRIFLVTDAMSTVGSDITEFRLNGRRVLRRDGRLTLEDGTLAGADLDLPTALAVMVNDVGVERKIALSMVTSGPAALLCDRLGFGGFEIGAPAHAIHLSADGNISRLQEHHS